MWVDPRLLVTDENPLLRSRFLRPEPCTRWQVARVCLLYTNQLSEPALGGSKAEHRKDYGVSLIHLVARSTDRMEFIHQMFTVTCAGHSNPGSPLLAVCP